MDAGINRTCTLARGTFTATACFTSNIARDSCRINFKTLRLRFTLLYNILKGFEAGAYNGFGTSSIYG